MGVYGWGTICLVVSCGVLTLSTFLIYCYDALKKTLLSCNYGCRILDITYITRFCSELFTWTNVTALCSNGNKWSYIYLNQNAKRIKKKHQETRLKNSLPALGQHLLQHFRRDCAKPPSPLWPAASHSGAHKLWLESEKGYLTIKMVVWWCYKGGIMVVFWVFLIVGHSILTHTSGEMMHGSKSWHQVRFQMISIWIGSSGGSTLSSCDLSLSRWTCTIKGGHWT